MLVYPQLSTGALGQFPIRKRHALRTVVNRAADGSTVKLADTSAELTEWQLDYASLADAEADALREFFVAAEGTLNGFSFLDPAGNLVAWSDKLEESVWERAPLLSLAGGVTDPVGGTAGWRLTNTGAGAQSVAQTLGGPGKYVYCLSAYARSEALTPVTMLAGENRAVRKIGPGWSRISFTATGDAEASSISFGLELPAGASVEVFGIQVEAQTAASGYKATTRGGIYANARLGDDILSITAMGENRHSCTLNIIHANHL
jgi:hypothetical protein